MQRYSIINLIIGSILIISAIQQTGCNRKKPPPPNIEEQNQAIPPTPKIDNAFDALDAGVHSVRIMNSQHITYLAEGQEQVGTLILNS